MYSDFYNSTINFDRSNVTGQDFLLILMLPLSVCLRVTEHFAVGVFEVRTFAVGAYAGGKFATGHFVVGIHAVYKDTSR